MSEMNSEHSLASRFLRDYGMIFVLLGLVILFSVLTLSLQHPTGEDAGAQAARKAADVAGEGGSVLIVARKTVEDETFVRGAREAAELKNLTVLAEVNGSPGDARKTIESILDEPKAIDAIIANDVTAKWTVFDQFEQIERSHICTPTPYLWPTFLKKSNLLGVANQTAIYAIIAIGMTMVIITAGIDLSVGSLVALASVISAMVVRDLAGGADAGIGGTILGIGIGLAACGAVGLFNGVMVTFFRLPSFIVTLGVMKMASGLAFRSSEGSSIPELPDSFAWLGGGDTLGIPNPVLLMIILYILAHIAMTRMTFGRYVYAIGGNVEAARLSGVPVRRVLIIVYCICGALAGLGGVVLTSQLGAGDPKFGSGYELEVIAAVVVGGTSLMGGEGKVLGTLIGAFIIAVIKNGMNLTNVDPFNQDIVLGAVLLAAVLIDTLKRRNTA